MILFGSTNSNVKNDNVIQKQIELTAIGSFFMLHIHEIHKEKGKCVPRL